MMPLPSYRAFLPWTVAIVVVGCGGQAAPESKTSAEPPPAAHAAPAPAGAREFEQQSTPASTRAADAPAPEVNSRPDADDDKYSYVDDIEALSRSLDRTLRLSVPDCTSAAALRDRICDLSQRICDIAARSAESEIEGHCADGKKRCARATASVRSSCAE